MLDRFFVRSAFRGPDEKQSNNQATNQSGTLDFFFFQKESSCDKLAAVIARLSVFNNLKEKAPDDVIKTLCLLTMP